MNSANDRSQPRRRIHGLSVGQLCILHLETLDTPLTAAERTFLLGNDPAAIADSADLCEDQGSSWTAHALESRDDDPESARVSLGEARSWSRDASQAAAALAYVNARPQAPTLVTFEAELDEIRRHERDWLAIHSTCDAAWNATENCPVHGAAITAGRERQQHATLALREAVRSAMRRAAEEPGRSGSSLNFGS